MDQNRILTRLIKMMEDETDCNEFDLIEAASESWTESFEL